MIMLTAPACPAEFRITHLVRAAGLMLGVFAMFTGVMHFGATLRLLPLPRPTLDMDRTILIHQAEASRTAQDAEVILIGDSSCMMDVAASELGRALARPVLNLGTLSYLDLSAFAEMLRHYEAANPKRLRTVVLLCHPEFLRRIQPVTTQVRTLKNFYAGEDYHDPSTWRGQLNWWLGVDVFRGRILSRFVPVPLPRDFARFYGFSNWELVRYLSEHHGSAVDPRVFVPHTGQGNAEYRLAAKLESDSAAFRESMPEGVQLVVGITPAPASFVPPNHEQRQQQMLTEWSRWLRAGAALTKLPATLPDENFATTT
ncbi:MAG: hypothetical protein HY043_12180, partial [Verrucomicrobia bacterium]|nr:hypothetical protein [Verrucomicrobiota bacterium]